MTMSRPRPARLRGFTLLELLVVMVIIGLLAGYVGPKFFGQIGKSETMVVIHNDAVVQGLSELPYMKDRRHWGILTIGTGLGNARFTNRKVPKKASK